MFVKQKLILKSMLKVICNNDEKYYSDNLSENRVYTIICVIIKLKRLPIFIHRTFPIEYIFPSNKVPYRHGGV